ncbi:MAG: hypothetical protein R2705_15175 [Ilumatobacteraceae bacterium]
MFRRWAALVITLLTLGAVLVTVAPRAEANRLAQGVIVNPDPVDYTPHIRNGHVEAIASAGDRVIVGGTFTSVQETGTWTIYTRSYLFAFDRNTGQLDQAFVPTLNGKVTTLQTSPDGLSVYVGGSFTLVNGVATYGIAKLDLATGQLVPGFAANAPGTVRDLALANGKVYLGGDFWSVNGVPRTRLAAVDALTGTVDPTFTVSTTAPRVNQDWVDELDISPDGTEMVIIGNFLAVDGLPERRSPASISPVRPPR